MKLPSLQFYPGDWKKDPGIQTLTLEEKGAWFELLLLMFESEDRGKLLLNGRPISSKDLANVLNVGEANVKQILSKLIANGVAKVSKNEDGSETIYCKRMVDDNRVHKARAEAGRKGGSKHKAKKKQMVPPSSSSSFSLKESSKEKFQPPTPKEATDYAKSLGFVLDGEKFVNHYAAGGWMRGKTRITNWKACVVTWRKNCGSVSSPAPPRAEIPDLPVRPPKQPYIAKPKDLEAQNDRPV